ncbi:hypothetical protein BDV25DRAFT_161228 [Aspergillus avenaceus]|uniref:Zinc finger PHD-type domain-containing protein n=1 Tax=Aspergillus avenaceus TaxID=36643 RepID=A0A5N6TKZ3_ASPAV|nr:hypothetical protein BDV25DRAFT_161228 [Aspergillus avenaceus]
MVSRKRTRSEVDSSLEQPPGESGMLHRLRNCWEFANLMQYIAIFGKPMKIDEEFGIEDLENECLKPGSSEKLLEIGLCLLKWISSHRGLTFDNFDEYTRRQYNSKAAHLPNPFGHDEMPKKFSEFDVFLKLRVLHQLTVWTFWNPDRLRDKMPEQRESDQTQWRIEELGYDREGRYYYILDDNRLYRRTEPPILPTRPTKSKTKKKSARAARASKRRRVSRSAAGEESSDEDNNNPDGELKSDYAERMKWECLAITLDDYKLFLDSIRRTKDPDEKILRDRIEDQVLPVIEKEEEAHERQRAKREKELFNLQLLAGAKRSSRIAGKQEKERQDREAAEAAHKREADLATARKEDERIKRMEEDRQSRIMTREQRIKDRERKRILHESELERIAEEQKKLERGEGRVSERQLKAELERQRRNLENLSQEDEWIFDCSGCGVHGENVDDGSHSVACEKCSIWQHSKCLGILQAEAEREDFHFICKDCKQREEEARMPKLPPLRFKVGSSPSSVVEGDDGAKDPQASLSFAAPRNGSPSKHTSLQPSLSHDASQPIPFQISPECRPQSAHATSHSPARASFSSKGANGSTPSRESLPNLPSVQQATQLPLHGRVSEGGSLQSLHSQRPSSSHSTQSPTLPSPIQNRPSMSPTQGNRDVGPLAGFPPAPSSDSSVPWTPYRQQQIPRPSSGNHPGLSALPGRHHSLAATPNASQSSPPQSSHGLPFSGISPTKQSPRPLTSSGLAGAPVLPPIQKLEPSPKLMGRSSPDAPIPPPVKCMTPEQEERRQREHAMMAQAHSQVNGQHSLASSPSLNRIPPLEPSALSQRPGLPFDSRSRPKTQKQ